MLAAPGDGTVLCGVAGWLWYPPIISFRTFGVNVGSSPEAVYKIHYIVIILICTRDIVYNKQKFAKLKKRKI